jgi:Trk-type K+ transport system membrane component
VKIGIVAIFVVNFGAFGFSYLMRLVCPQIARRAYIGYYLVLMPIMFAAWEDPMIWFHVGFAVAGLVVITVAARRVLASGA